MKTFILSIFALVLLAGCKEDTPADLNARKNMVLDTTALYNGSVLTDRTYPGEEEALTTEEELPDGTTTTTTTVTTTTVTKRTSGTPTAAIADPVRVSRTATKPVAKRSSTSPAVRKSSGAGTQASTPAVVRKRDKGWSDAAKGTAIGAGSGAIIGAVVSKNKVKGAVIGGIIGAGGGYVIGRARDKKSGRVERNKQADFVYY